LAYGFGGAASDADVDFVEDQGAGGGVLAGFGGVFFYGDFEGQHDAGHFAAEAISARGLSGSPGLVEMRHSTVSQPVVVQWAVPSGAKAGSLFCGVNVRAEARTLHAEFCLRAPGGMHVDFEFHFHGEGVYLGLG